MMMMMTLHRETNAVSTEEQLRNKLGGINWMSHSVVCVSSALL